MAISDDPTRGTGADKTTESVDPAYEAPPHAGDSDTAGAGDPARGGCLRFGWGCLPVLLGAMLVPTSLFF